MADTSVAQPGNDRVMQPPAVLLFAMVLLVLIRLVAPGPRLPYPANLVGMLPLALGVYLNLAANGLLKRHSTIVKVRPGSTALVTEGSTAIPGTRCTWASSCSCSVARSCSAR